MCTYYVTLKASFSFSRCTGRTATVGFTRTAGGGGVGLPEASLVPTGTVALGRMIERSLVCTPGLPSGMRRVTTGGLALPSAARAIATAATALEARAAAGPGAAIFCSEAGLGASCPSSTGRLEGRGGGGRSLPLSPLIDAVRAIDGYAAGRAGRSRDSDCACDKEEEAVAEWSAVPCGSWCLEQSGQVHRGWGSCLHLLHPPGMGGREWMQYHDML